MDGTLLTLILLLPWVFLVGSIMVSVIHAAEEIWGEGGPFNRYIARLSGSGYLDDFAGLMAATLLPASLIVLVWCGYISQLPFALQ